MRAHGDPNQADPTVTADKVINVPWPDAGMPGGIFGTNKGGQGNSGPGQYCRAYLNEAQGELGNGQRSAHIDQAQMERAAECMRAHGIPDFPDPTGDNLSMSVGGDLNPMNPTFQAAVKLCARKTGVQLPGSGSPPPGTVEINGSGPGLAVG
jgi:hypothetical protein